MTLLIGARQTGKSALVQSLVSGGLVGTYLTLDDGVTLAAAASDPDGFVAGLAGTVAIDEVQRAPALLPAIKASVDRDRRAGRFVLTPRDVAASSYTAREVVVNPPCSGCFSTIVKTRVESVLRRYQSGRMRVTAA